MENKTGYIPYLDGCRALAILFVVFSHVGLGKIIPGRFGVSLFFFLSGFLITRLLLTEIKEKGRISFAAFYLRRLFRLYPALLAMILCSSIAAYLMNCSLQTKDVFAALFYYTNYYIGWVRIPVENCGRLLDIFWSLSIEEHFYLVFPLIIQLALKKQSDHSIKTFIYLLISLCIACLGMRAFTFFYYHGDLDFVSNRIYFSSHTRIDSIIWGCLSAVLVFQQSSGKYFKFLQNKWVIASGVLALLVSFTYRNDFFRQTLFYTIQGYGIFILVPLIGVHKNKLLKNLLSNDWLIFIGKLSYSLYLFHWIALKMSTQFFIEFSLNWQLLFWPLTILLSLSSYYLVEQPFMQLRKKFGSSLH